MQQARRHDLARALAPRYAQASSREKSELLDDLWNGYGVLLLAAVAHVQH